MLSGKRLKPECEVIIAKHGWMKQPESAFTKKLAIFRLLAKQVLNDSFDPVAHEILRSPKPRNIRKFIAAGKELALDDLCKIFLRDA